MHLISLWTSPKLPVYNIWEKYPHHWDKTRAAQLLRFFKNLKNPPPTTPRKGQSPTTLSKSDTNLSKNPLRTQAPMETLTKNSNIRKFQQKKHGDSIQQEYDSKIKDENYKSTSSYNPKE